MAKKRVLRRPRKPAKRRVRARARGAASRKGAGKTARRAAGKAARRAAGKTARRAAGKTARRGVGTIKRVARPTARRVTQKAERSTLTPRLERERRKLSDIERLEPAKTMSDARMLSAARAGHDELRAELQRHTETSPELTAGDVDAKWQDAYSIGDEAPGGDNPTPDQDRVDDIGKALGVQYQDNEELQGGDEITKRDQKRWELDPASSDDWPHKDEE